jgi:hypothetical protein
MGIRFQEDFLGEDLNYRVIIYDSTYPADTLDTFMLMDNGCILKEGGDPFNVIETIRTSTLSLNILIDSPELNLFVEDLTNFEGDRFYVEVKTYYQYQGPDFSETSFLGKILVEDVKLSDEETPVLSLSAIDGIADLKYIDYSYVSDSIYRINPLKDLILSCLQNLPTIDLYEDTDEIATVYSNILAEDLFNENIPTFNSKELYINGCLNNYFFKEESGKQKIMNCYEVLEEICKRFFLTCRYRHGKYEFIGIETIHDGVETTALNILKNGTYTNGSLLKLDNIDISDKIYAGGQFNWKEGYKSVYYELPETEISVGKLTDYDSWENRKIEYYVGNQTLFEEPYESDEGFFVGNGYEQVFNEALQDGIPYFLRTYIYITNMWWYNVRPLDVIRLRFTIYETPVGGTKEEIAQFTKEYTFGARTVQIVSEIGAKSYDRNVSIKVELVDYIDTVIWLTLRWSSFLRFRNQDGTEISHLAAVEEGSFKQEKGIKLFKKQNGGDLLSILTLWNIDKLNNYDPVYRPRIIQTFKINSSSPAYSWEEMTLRRILAIYRASLKTYNCSFNGYVMNRIGNLEIYNDGEYSIGTITYNYKTSINQANLFQIKTLDESNISYIEKESWVLETDETDTSGFGQISGESGAVGIPPKLFKFDNHASNEAILTGYDIPNSATDDSLVKSIRVVVNGREYRQVFGESVYVSYKNRVEDDGGTMYSNKSCTEDAIYKIGIPSNVPTEMGRDTYYVDKENDKIVFNLALRGDRVEVWVTDYFVTIENPLF